VVGAVRLSSDGDCVENSDCNINITRHAVMRHESHMSKYLEAAIEELIETLRKCISELFERGVVQPVSARWREVEKGRRNYRKYLNKISCCGCHDRCVLHRCDPYPNRQPLVIFDARMAKKAKAHGVSVLRRLDV
jgi:hypothetical protein